MYFLSLSVTLLTIIASVHLLAKVRNENLGIFSKLLAYFVLLTAVLILACQLFRGVNKMEHREGKCKKECKMMMGEEGDHHMMMKKMHHGAMEGKCARKGCCEEGKCPHMGADGKCNMKEGEECSMACCSNMKEECKCEKGEDGKCKEGKDCKMDCCNSSAMKGECKMHKEVEVIIEEKK